MYVFMGMQMHTKLVKQQWGGKILSLYHKVAFFMYERAVFWEYGRAMGITFLGKSEHMRYINFGKFYIEETKKILENFQTRFSSLKRKRKMAFCGRGKLSKIVEDRFFKRLLACSGRFQVFGGRGRFCFRNAMVNSRCSYVSSMLYEQQLSFLFSQSTVCLHNS